MNKKEILMQKKKVRNFKGTFKEQGSNFRKKAKSIEFSQLEFINGRNSYLEEAERFFKGSIKYRGMQRVQKKKA